MRSLPGPQSSALPPPAPPLPPAPLEPAVDDPPAPPAPVALFEPTEVLVAAASPPVPEEAAAPPPLALALDVEEVSFAGEVLGGRCLRSARYALQQRSSRRGGPLIRRPRRLHRRAPHVRCHLRRRGEVLWRQRLWRARHRLHDEQLRSSRRGGPLIRRPRRLRRRQRNVRRYLHRRREMLGAQRSWRARRRLHEEQLRSHRRGGPLVVGY